MTTVEFCRDEQRRCAAEYIATNDPGALLGMHDNFAEEFLMEQEKPDLFTNYTIFWHPTRKLDPWGEEVEVIGLSRDWVFFRNRRGMDSMLHINWRRAVSK